MLSRPVFVLLTAGVFTTAIIYVVHHNQTTDRKRMRKGVERDIERQQRKAENIRLLEEQRTLTRNLENRKR